MEGKRGEHAQAREPLRAPQQMRSGGLANHSVGGPWQFFSLPVVQLWERQPLPDAASDPVVQQFW